MDRRFVGCAGVAALLAAGVAFAQQDVVRIAPVPALGTEIADVARTSEQMAEGTVVGAGRWLRIAYRSGVPIVGFVAPMRGSQYNPVDMLRFDLPETDAAVVEIDLAASSSWNPTEKTYLVSLASPASALSPEIQGVEIVPGAGGVAGAAAWHLMAPESFAISTYHRLRGYRVLGVGVVPTLAVLFAAACGIVAVRRRAAALASLLGLALGMQLLYGARVGADLVRLSFAHGREWSRGSYAEAGSAHALADAVREIADEQDVRLAVCFDSTDYAAKLLRYDLYPIPVAWTGEIARDATHVAVVRKIDWSFEDGRLRCGDMNVDATLLEEFPDGSRLFFLSDA